MRLISIIYFTQEIRSNIEVEFDVDHTTFLCCQLIDCCVVLFLFLRYRIKQLYN